MPKAARRVAHQRLRLRRSRSTGFDLVNNQSAPRVVDGEFAGGAKDRSHAARFHIDLVQCIFRGVVSYLDFASACHPLNTNTVLACFGANWHRQAQ